jgi:hypothetical protein
MGELVDGVQDALVVYAYQMVQLGGGAVFHKVVGQSQADDVGVVSVVAHVFQYFAAKSALYHAVFQGDNLMESFAYFVQYLYVDGFQETHVVVGGVYPVFLYESTYPYTERTYGKYGQRVAVVQLTPFAYRYFTERTLPVYNGTASSGVTYYEGSLVGKLGGVHKVTEFMFVHRRRYGEVGDGTQES